MQSLHISPAAAVLLGTLGILLIYLELNRPGLIIPGAVGLLILLLAVAALSQWSIRVAGIAVCFAAVLFQLLGLAIQTSWIGAIAAGITFGYGCRHLIAGGTSTNVDTPATLAAGLIMGPGTSILTAIARRARTNKGLDL